MKFLPHLLLLLVLCKSMATVQAQSTGFLIGGTVQPSGGVNNLPYVSGGTNYASGQTAFLDCSQTTILISIPIILENSTNDQYGSVWSSTGGYTITDTPISSVKQVTIPSNGASGSISAAYYSSTAGLSNFSTIGLRQKPDAPALSSLPPACLSVGQTGTSSASVNYPFQNNNPLQLVWQGAGGVTIEGNSTYVTNSNTGSVNVQNSSYGTFTVYSRIPGCNNLQSDPVSTYIGPPQVANVSVNNTLNPGPVSAGSGSTNYVQATSAYNYLPSYSFSSYTNSGNISLSLSGVNNGNAQVYVSGSVGNASLNITASNSCGSNTRAVVFYIPYSYGIVSNPATDKLTLAFSETDNPDALPDQIDLLSEKDKSIVRSVSVKELYKTNGFANGKEVAFDITSLPRGTYYVRVTNPRREKEKQIETIRVLFE